MQTPCTLEQLIALTAEGRRFEYLFFWGHQPKANGTIAKTCMSQWFESAFTLGGVVYPTAEHYMMAEKARLFDAQHVLGQILTANTPALAKKLGREIPGYDDQRWNARRFDAVVEGNLAKFTQNPALGSYLLGTAGRILVEASPVDKVWGVGLAQDDPKIGDPGEWQGLNLLGFALMRVREKMASS